MWIVLSDSITLCPLVWAVRWCEWNTSPWNFYRLKHHRQRWIAIAPVASDSFGHESIFEWIKHQLKTLSDVVGRLHVSFYLISAIKPLQLEVVDGRIEVCKQKRGSSQHELNLYVYIIHMFDRWDSINFQHMDTLHELCISFTFCKKWVRIELIVIDLNEWVISSVTLGLTLTVTRGNHVMYLMNCSWCSIHATDRTCEIHWNDRGDHSVSMFFHHKYEFLKQFCAIIIQYLTLVPFTFLKYHARSQVTPSVPQEFMLVIASSAWHAKQFDVRKFEEFMH